MADLHALAMNGDAQGIVQLLKSGGGDSRPAANEIVYGRAPLHHAARKGHHDAAKALLICGANPNLREANNGETPLHIACTEGHTQLISLLLER